MKGSYREHSADTEAYQQGRNSAEWNHNHPDSGSLIRNPYPAGDPGWLDWQIGYEVWVEETTKNTEEPNSPPKTLPVILPPLYDPFYNDRLM